MAEQADKDGSGYAIAIFMLCIMAITCITALGVGAEDTDGPLAVAVIVWPYMGITFFTLLYQGISAWQMFKHKSAYVCIICGIIFLGICLAWLGVMLKNKIISSPFISYYTFLAFIQMVTLVIGIWYLRMRKDL